MAGIPYLLLRSGIELFSFPVWNLRPVGVAWMTVGGLLYGFCVLDLALTGKGTLAVIDPPKALVSKHLYLVVRNPMYVSILLILTGEAFLDRKSTRLNSSH